MVAQWGDARGFELCGMGMVRGECFIAVRGGQRSIPRFVHTAHRRGQPDHSTYHYQRSASSYSDSSRTRVQLKWTRTLQNTRLGLGLGFDSRRKTSSANEIKQVVSLVAPNHKELDLVGHS